MQLLLHANVSIQTKITSLCSILQNLGGAMRQKAGNWQPSWILAAVLIFLSDSDSE